MHSLGDRPIAALAVTAILLLIGVFAFVAVGGGVAAADGGVIADDFAAADIGDADGVTTADMGDGAFASQEIDADRVVLRATVDNAGVASWVVEYRVRLNDPDREAAFEDLQEDVRTNESAYADRFRDRMVSTADTAASTTDRSMEIRDVTVETERRELPESYGILRYEFEWTGFAAVSDDRLAMGDALAGFFLEEGHRLTLEWPDGFELESVRPTPTDTGDNSVTWVGPTDFAADEPRVVTTSSPAIGIGGTGIALGLLAVLAVGLAAGYRRRDWIRSILGRRQPAAADHRDATDPGSADADEIGAASVEAGAASDTSTDERSEADGVGTGDDESPPAELLSNEERVLRLLRDNGGRMKQQDVVQSLGWTDARTSQVVSGLREDGELESFRLGRENVLRLPTEDSDGDPHDGLRDGSDSSRGGSDSSRDGSDTDDPRTDR